MRTPRFSLLYGGLYDCTPGGAGRGRPAVPAWARARPDPSGPRLHHLALEGLAMRLAATSCTATQGGRAWKG